MTPTHNPSQNHLLAALPAAEFARVAAHLELETMKLGEVLCQPAVCNRHHSVEQQLCRWLLVTLDRIPSGEFVMTQELVASMLGVRREGITEAAGKLQLAGFIRCRRGQISVLRRSGLEGRACECYAVVKKELGRLLSDVRHRQAQPAL